MSKVLRSRDVSRLTGLPLYTLTRWVGYGWITPIKDSKGSGDERLWDWSVLKEIADLRERIDACPHPHQ